VIDTKELYSPCRLLILPENIRLSHENVERETHYTAVTVALIKSFITTTSAM
jgi:hypothetical protein